MVNKVLNILVIDDDRVDQMQLVRSIKSSGFQSEIKIANNVEEGIEFVRQFAFDCIFIDFNLPDGNGFDFLKQHKAGVDNAPVVIVTSYGDEQLAADAIKLGACDYLPKNLISADWIGQNLRNVLRLNEEKKSSYDIKLALEESERKLAAVIERSPIILFAVNSEKTVTIFQGKGVENININPDDIVGKQLEQVTSKLPEINQYYSEAAKGKE